MKAMVATRYGSPDVLHLVDVERPTPKADEVLIKVMASSVNSADYRMMKADPFMIRFVSGLLKPKQPILGADVAGVVEAVGAEVTQFTVGDTVFGDLALAGMGAYAEYVCTKASVLAHKPAAISFEDAAATPLAGITALQGLRDHGKLQAGQRVLVNGAASGVGSWAVRLAKALGAHVTAAARAPKLEMVRQLGADAVLDASQVDLTQPAQPYDLILDVAAFRPFTDYRPALTPTGTYVMAGGSMGQIFKIALHGLVGKKGGPRFVNFVAKGNAKDAAYLAGLMATGEVAPFIDRVYPLEQLPDAMRRMERREVQGKLVITVGSTSN